MKFAVIPKITEVTIDGFLEISFPKIIKEPRVTNRTSYYQNITETLKVSLVTQNI
jgi:hypothetical protein